MKEFKNPPIIVYFNGTFVNLENGAHARLFDMLTFLDQHFASVTLYSYANHVTCPWTPGAAEKFKRFFPRIKLVLENHTRPLRWFTRLKNFLLSVFPQQGRLILRMRLPGAARQYRQLQDSAKDAVWIVNYADGMTQLNGVPEANKIIVETHGLKFVEAAKVAGTSLLSVRNLLKLRSEAAALERASGLVAISPLEKAIFKILSPETHNFYIPVYYKIEERILEPKPVEEELKYDLLFTASENINNIEGLEKFVESHAVWLSKYRLALCGHICKEKRIEDLARKYGNIELLGYVEDLTKVYRSAKAVISPTDGTGLKIKVVDALLHGKPVFGSGHTRNGLPEGYEGCVLPLEPAIMDSILSDPEERRIAERAVFAYLRAWDHVNETGALLNYLRGTKPCEDFALTKAPCDTSQ